MSITKSNRKIVSIDGGDPTIASRVTVLENNAYKVTYYAVISGASGTITPPTGATFNAGEFSGLNCILSEIDGSNKPTYISPRTSAGVIVTATLNTSTGAWATSATYASASIALIYSIKITALNYSNLTYANIIQSEKDVLTLPVPLADTVYSTGWHIAPTSGVKGTSSGYGGNIWWYPYPVGVDRTVTDIGIEVTTGAAASNIRLALYADTGAGRPGSLIEDSGNISSVGTGLLSYTFATPKYLLASNKFYWLGFQASAAGIAIRYSNIISNMPRSTGGFVGICTLAQVFGAFPASAVGYSENTSGAYISIQLKVQ